eukprot:COSAG04_NODE_15_length_40535_cov_25.319888_5_plen_315_part_00
MNSSSGQELEHLDAAALRAMVREAGAGTLELVGYDATCGGAELAAALAAEGAGLTGLDLYSLKLGADGWRAAFEALRKGACPQLATLSLGYCDLGPAGGAALAVLLVDLPALTKLFVGGNDLGDAAFGALAEALGRGACPGMATLHAPGNGLTVLPEALCGVASLKVLSLGGNDIGSLPHGLLHLTRLRRLNIGGNARLTAEAEIMGDVKWNSERQELEDNDVGALFVHLRAVHDGEPPPLDDQASVYIQMRKGDARQKLRDLEVAAALRARAAAQKREEKKAARLAAQAAQAQVEDTPPPAEPAPALVVVAEI